MIASLLLAVALAQAPPVSAELVSSITGVKPGGMFLVGVVVRIDPGYHIYWSNPGDTGAPTDVAWTLPEGWKAGPILWPIPTRFNEKKSAVYGYEGSTILLARITTASDARTGKFKIAAHLQWTTGGLGTVPGSADLSMSRTVNDDTYLHPVWGSRLTDVEAALPQPAPKWSFVAEPTKGGFILKSKPDALVDVTAKLPVFYASVPGVLEASAPQNFRANADGTFWLALKSVESVAPARLTGILVLPDGNAVTVDVPITPAGQ